MIGVVAVAPVGRRRRNDRDHDDVVWFAASGIGGPEGRSIRRHPPLRVELPGQRRRGAAAACRRRGAERSDVDHDERRRQGRRHHRQKEEAMGGR
jgi:hypothetical protein